MKNVFLDTNIVLELGKSPHGLVFARVIDLIESEQIRMLTTDLTQAEVIGNHTRRDFKEMKCICNPKLRKMIDETINSGFPAITEERLREVLKEKYHCLINKFFEKMDTKILNIGAVNSDKVFKEYTNEKGFFADGNKKNQFPDAFVFERLKNEASQNEPIIIVSKDRDFEKPVIDQKHISLVKSLPDLFSELGLKLEYPDIDQFLVKNYEEITRMVNDELSNWGLLGDIENSEITEKEVININIDKTIAFESAEKGGPILVVGQFYVLTSVYFTHPDEDSFVYDPEDGRLLFFDTAHSDNTIELKIDVSLSIAVNENGDPVEIEKLEFRNDNFAYVELHVYEYDWY